MISFIASLDIVDAIFLMSVSLSVFYISVSKCLTFRHLFSTHDGQCSKSMVGLGPIFFSLGPKLNMIPADLAGKRLREV